MLLKSGKRNIIFCGIAQCCTVITLQYVLPPKYPIEGRMITYRLQYSRAEYINICSSRAEYMPR